MAPLDERERLHIACVYMLDRDHGSSMDLIRFRRMAEALARQGYSVDIVQRRPSFGMLAPRLRRVPVRDIRWDRYGAIKVSIHSGFERLSAIGGAEHPFVVASLGSVVGNGPRPGVHFFGQIHERLLATQHRIASRARAVNLLTDENERAWLETHGPQMLRLRVPTGVDRVLPPPGPDPYRRLGLAGRAVLFAGNIYAAEQAEVNAVWIDRLNRLGRALQKRGLQLVAMGPGEKAGLDADAVRHVGLIPADAVWDWQRHAAAGVVIAHGPEQDNESSKIYYYLRTELPVICEAPVPNRWLVEQTGHGAIVALGDIEAMADAAEGFAARRPASTGLGDWMATEHSWDERASRYESLFDEALLSAARPRPKPRLRVVLERVFAPALSRTSPEPPHPSGTVVLLSPGLDERNVWGERIVARGVYRALRRVMPGARVELLDIGHRDRLGKMSVDLLVSMCTGPRHPWRADDVGHSIDGVSMLWVLNHPELLHEFAALDFDGFLSNSTSAVKRLAAHRPAAWCPLGVDTDWAPRAAQARYRAAVTYLGSGGIGNKDPRTTHQYLDPAKRFDFGLWGPNWDTDYWDPVHRLDPASNDWHRYWRGPLAVGEEAALYGSAGVVLGYHADGQREWGMWNNRVFEVLASGAAFISDRATGLSDEFGDCVAFTDGGDETAAHIERLLANPHERQRMGDAGRRLVMARYTYDHAAERIVDHYRILAEMRGLAPIASTAAPARDGSAA